MTYINFTSVEVDESSRTKTNLEISDQEKESLSLPEILFHFKKFLNSMGFAISSVKALHEKEFSSSEEV